MDKVKSNFFFSRCKMALNAAMIVLLCSGCASLGKKRGEGYFVQEGLASYYAQKYHGRKTASGEIFNINKFTAAHRTLPFGTKVQVTNLENGRQTNVRINDRGPFVRGRIIDLSPVAAKKLDMMKQGVVKVKIEGTK